VQLLTKYGMLVINCIWSSTAFASARQAWPLRPNAPRPLQRQQYTMSWGIACHVAAAMTPIFAAYQLGQLPVDQTGHKHRQLSRTVADLLHPILWAMIASNHTNIAATTTRYVMRLTHFLQHAPLWQPLDPMHLVAVYNVCFRNSCGTAPMRNYTDMPVCQHASLVTAITCDSQTR
jgi:hypothetical protein